MNAKRIKLAPQAKAQGYSLRKATIRVQEAHDYGLYGLVNANGWWETGPGLNRLSAMPYTCRSRRMAGAVMTNETPPLYTEEFIANALGVRTSDVTKAHDEIRL